MDQNAQSSNPRRTAGARLPLMTVVMAVLVSLLTASTAVALGYVFPSTNDLNAAEGFPHVVELPSDPGEVSLRFVNETNSLAFFEVRIDGEELMDGTAHPVVISDFVYPGHCVDSRNVGPAPGCAVGFVEVTFEAADHVDVRLALGGERDWDFDWTSFDAGSVDKQDCKKGGWRELGFANQGACIKFVNNG